MTIPINQMLIIMSPWVLLGLMVGGITLRRSLFLFVTVEGWSMAPALKHQDHVLVLRMWAARKIKKGAIVLLDASAAQQLSLSNVFFIKRVVAVAGDIYTDPDTSVPLRSIDKPSSPKETRRWHIPPGMVFVCGDNLPDSLDSRTWGPVPLSAIKGVVIHHFKKQTP